MYCFPFRPFFGINYQIKLHVSKLSTFLHYDLFLYFKYQILYICKLASLSGRKSTQMREGTFSLRNERN